MDFELIGQVVSATIAVAAVLSNFIPRHTLIGKLVHFLAARRAPAPVPAPKDASVPGAPLVAEKAALNTQVALRERLQEADRASRMNGGQ